MQPPKNMTVSVIAKPLPGGGYGFELDAYGKGPAQDIDIDNDGHPGVIVNFKIKDADKNGLEFRPVPSDALWVQLNGAPPAPWPGFIPLSVEKDKNGRNTRLIAYCRNENQGQQFKFTLRFVGPNGPVDYDPIGNGNNGQRE
jgi:hypothetical protein